MARLLVCIALVVVLSLLDLSTVSADSGSNSQFHQVSWGRYGNFVGYNHFCQQQIAPSVAMKDCSVSSGGNGGNNGGTGSNYPGQGNNGGAGGNSTDGEGSNAGTSATISTALMALPLIAFLVSSS